MSWLANHPPVLIGLCLFLFIFGSGLARLLPGIVLLVIVVGSIAWMAFSGASGVAEVIGISSVWAYLIASIIVLLAIVSLWLFNKTS